LATAREFRHELGAAIKAAGLTVEREAVARFVEEIAGSEITERRARAAAVKRSPEGSPLAGALPPASARDGEQDTTSAGASLVASERTTRDGVSARAKIAFGAVAGLLMVLGVVLIAISMSPKRAKPVAGVEPAAEPASAAATPKDEARLRGRGQPK
jgi:hypothetical protein